jgi:hypothetical protein
MTTYQTLEHLNSFRLINLRFTICAIDPVILPDYHGSALRGAFGHAFKKACCAARVNDCQDCPLKGRCVYAYVFETECDPTDPFIRNQNGLPHPYIFRPQLNPVSRVHPGSDIEFNLILIGKAMEYVMHCAYAAALMGDIGLAKGSARFNLHKIESLDISGKPYLLFPSEGQQLDMKNLQIIAFQDICRHRFPENPCTLRLLTRTDIQKNGSRPDITFGVLFRRLLRRVTTLAHLHCNAGFNTGSCIDEFHELSDMADNVVPISKNIAFQEARRWSNRQHQDMPFSGVLGEITFSGDMTPFWPFLLLGEWVHVGKKATFGFGRYEIAG